jgi:SPP1 family predicted phage head-tail adaptor
VIGAGRLKTRLVIAAPVEADDGQGGVTRGFAAVATVWAAVQPGRGRRAVEAGADGAAVSVRILLRNAVALTLQHRLIDGARSYSITALREIDDGRMIEIDAEWRAE